MIAVRMMEVAADAVIDMVGMRNRLVATVRSVNVLLRVGFAPVIRRAGCRIGPADSKTVLVDVTGVGMMQVTIVQIVDVAAVADGGVATTRPMLVSMVGMVGC